MSLAPKHSAEIAQRFVDAERQAIALIAESGDITEAEAAKVFVLYRSKKVRALKLDVWNGRYKATHGGFWDRETIRRALEMATEQAV